MSRNLRQVMSMAGLSSTARLAYLWIHWTARNGSSTATNLELGEKVGVSEDRMTAIARELADANLVKRDRTGAKGKGRARWVILPGLLAAAAIGTGPVPADAASFICNQPSATFSYQDPEEVGKGRRRKKAA